MHFHFKLCFKKTKPKGTYGEFMSLIKFSAVSSLFVLCSQWLAADLLSLIVVLLWRFWVGHHVPSMKTSGKKR